MNDIKKQQNLPSTLDLQEMKDCLSTSPAFILDVPTINNALAILSDLRSQCGCKILFSVKALPLSSILEMTQSLLDGFSVSSLFEAQLANEILPGQGSTHLTTPGLRQDEWQSVTGLTSHISFNSLTQYQRFYDQAPKQVSLGIRLNPKLSFLNDDRFNPCRQHSKLGVDIDEYCQLPYLDRIDGLHFHTVFSAMNFEPLIQTIAKLRHHLKDELAQLQWLNLGGGYLFNKMDCQPFIEQVKQLKTDFGLEVYIEPGKAIVGEAGYLIASVLDVFTSDGKTVAILDTSINHHPEVFEYQRQPDCHEHDVSGSYITILAGCTCLAGDIFGEYRFSEPINIGDKITFKHVGAYSLIKANRFNGYNLPDIYLHDSGQLTKIKQYHYEAYRQQWLADR